MLSEVSRVFIWFCRRDLELQIIVEQVRKEEDGFEILQRSWSTVMERKALRCSMLMRFLQKNPAILAALSIRVTDSYIHFHRHLSQVYIPVSYLERPFKFIASCHKRSRANLFRKGNNA